MDLTPPLYPPLLSLCQDRQKVKKNALNCQKMALKAILEHCIVDYLGSCDNINMK